MPAITQAEIRENAHRFVHEWRDENRERAEAQSFWNDFFRVFGVQRPKVAAFEKAVRKLGGGRGRIDVPDLMPLRLHQAHRALDAAVDGCYGRRQFKTDLERLEFLFELYRQYTEPLRQLAERETRRAARRKR